MKKKKHRGYYKIIKAMKKKIRKEISDASERCLKRDPNKDEDESAPAVLNAYISLEDWLKNELEKYDLK
jgi:hypothetical protein